jgi:glyoxylase-like metal-dependent hydrolase (beta-lactamase superfamily II)
MKFRVIPVTAFEQNCTLLWCEQSKRGALVDPGGDIERLLQAVVEEGVTVEKLLVTHGHADHAGATAILAKKLGVPIEGPHEEDRFLLDDLPQQAARFGFARSESFTPDRWLQDGDTVTVGEDLLTVRHAPGHTPGHVVFFHAPTKVALVGDVLFNRSIGRTDFPRGDFDTLVASIRERLFPLGDEVAFIPGHGPMSTFGDERQFNPFVGQRD